MPFTYRGSGPWGAGTGAPLTQAQFDGNTYEAQTRIEALEAAITAFGGVIESVTLSGTTLTFHLVGGAQHQVTLPVPRPNRVEAWQPDTFYVPWDFVTHNGSVYIVLFAHQSAATFDPGANNGQGQDYYGLFFTEPALMLPEGGLTGQVLGKASNADFDCIWTYFALGDLQDVELDDPAIGQHLVFDGAQWINASLVLPPPAEDSRGGVELFEPAANQFLTGVDSNGEFSAAQPSFANLSGRIGMNQHSAAVDLGTQSGSVLLDPADGGIFQLTPTANCTIDAIEIPIGFFLTVLIVTSGTTSYSVDFDPNSFVSAGALSTGTESGKSFTLTFRSNGVRFYEISRTEAM
jgi:hypothetical protein